MTQFISVFLLLFCVFSENIYPTIISNPQVEIDSQGNHVAIWVDHTNVNSTINSVKKYAGLTTWEHDIRVISSPLSRAINPQLIMNDLGQAVVVWIETNVSSNFTMLMGASFTFENGWTNPLRISLDHNVDSEEFFLNESQQGFASVIWKAFSDQLGEQLFVGCFIPNNITGGNWVITNLFNQTN